MKRKPHYNPLAMGNKVVADKYGRDMMNYHKGLEQKQEPSYRQRVGEKVYRERERAFLKDNYMGYIKKSLMIGFTNSFPEDKTKVIDEITVTMKCRGQDVTFKVRYGAVTFGDGKHSCSGITTDRCEVPRPGPLGGWGSHSYADEAEAMELAVVQMAAKHDLMICDKRCSWPHAKAIVQKIDEAHVRCYEPKETTKTT